MEILKTVEEIQTYAKKQKAQGKTIALVPTMGAIHEGHLALNHEARKKADILITSIFVNPTQFGENEDFASYPRTFEEDRKKLQKENVDAIYLPTPKEMYPEGFGTYVSPSPLVAEKLCGLTRPIHFRGVATVVLKLFNLTRADYSFFGQKDAQQVAVLRRMILDLNVNTKLFMVPIVREKDGLAKSSRNLYLNKEERQAALILSQSLFAVEKSYQRGEHDVRKLVDILQKKIKEEKLATLEYAEIFTFPDLLPLTKVEEVALVALAVHIGKTRLIDNIILGGKKACYAIC